MKKQDAHDPRNTDSTAQITNADSIPPMQEGRRRRLYPPEVYTRLTNELHALIDTTPNLKPDRETWDIEGNWKETGHIYFIDYKYHRPFLRLIDFDCRNIKLVNLERPAARLTFFAKHHYKLRKAEQIDRAEKETILTDYIEKLESDIEKVLNEEAAYEGRRLKKLESLREEQSHFTDYLNRIDSVDLAISNYHQQKMYTNVNIKYRTHQPLDDEWDNESVYLLNHQRDREGQITQPRYNVIFIDVAEITNEHPLQNKEVHLYLARFPRRSFAGALRIYVRETGNTGGEQGQHSQHGLDSPSESGYDSKNGPSDKPGSATLLITPRFSPEKAPAEPMTTTTTTKTERQPTTPPPALLPSLTEAQLPAGPTIKETEPHGGPSECREGDPATADQRQLSLF